MRIMMVTTPLRPVPTAFPPLGSLSVINYLRKNSNHNIEFYNIDSLRPTFEESVKHIVSANPDILGISAVVSTAYAYTKKLSLAVKAKLPETLIVVGGNLAASAEVLLRKTGTDLCVTGEGEKTFLKIADHAKKSRTPSDFIEIPGLAFLDSSMELINTGFETPLEKNEIYDIDWNDLEVSSDISRFIYFPLDDSVSHEWLIRDPRTAEPHRRHKKIGEIQASKGCVARCTFCHRFDKGIRYIPIDVLRKRISQMVDRYDIGFLIMGDENFGTDRKWLTNFCEMIKPFDLLWRVAGMRVNCITPEQIEMMREAGCVSIMYGMETGSQRILEVMEKKTTIEQNRQAMDWTIRGSLYSIIQLVIGMPGECRETIKETIEFTKFGLTLEPSQNPNNLSINYAQALPGTPLYEFARHKKIIGQSLEDEEQYLINISDRNAHDEFSTLNFTESSTLEAQTWRPLITIETNYAYVRKFGIKHYHSILLKDANYFHQRRNTDGRFANPRQLIDTSIATDSLHKTRQRMHLDEVKIPSLFQLLRSQNFGMAMICYPVLFYHLRHFLPFIVTIKNINRVSMSYGVRTFGHYIIDRFTREKRGTSEPFDFKSLRKIVWKDYSTLPEDDQAMMPLRRGR